MEVFCTQSDSPTEPINLKIVGRMTLIGFAIYGDKKIMRDMTEEIFI